MAFHEAIKLKAVKREKKRANVAAGFRERAGSGDGDGLAMQHGEKSVGRNSAGRNEEIWGSTCQIGGRRG